MDDPNRLCKIVLLPGPDRNAGRFCDSVIAVVGNGIDQHIVSLEAFEAACLEQPIDVVIAASNALALNPPDATEAVQPSEDGERHLPSDTHPAPGLRNVEVANRAARAFDHVICEADCDPAAH